MTPVERGVITRRIKRRARIWREWQFPDPATFTKTPEDQLREAAVPRLYYKPRPALSRQQLRELVDQVKADTVSNIRMHIQALRRGGPHMHAYHREQVIKWLGNLRRWPDAEKAFETVSKELQP